MAIDTTSPRPRRALLAGAVGGVAALAAHALGRPTPAQATHQGYVQLDHDNKHTTLTSFGRINGGGSATLASEIIGVLAGGPTGVHGYSSTNSGRGVYGIGFTGVHGYANTEYGRAVFGEVPGTIPATGVLGKTGGHSSQVAVDGDTTAGNGEGIAIRARTKNGIGLYGEATGGYALQVHGRAVFNRSGRTTIAAGNASKTISGHTMTSATVVVATVQGNPAGVWVRSVSVSDANETFTIRLNKVAPAGGVVVGFFIVN